MLERPCSSRSSTSTSALFSVVLADHRFDVVGGAHALEIGFGGDERDQQVAQVVVVFGNQDSKGWRVHDA